VYRVLQWFKDGIRGLALSFHERPTKALAADIGWETVALIVVVREKAKVWRVRGETDWTKEWECPSCRGGLFATVKTVGCRNRMTGNSCCAISLLELRESNDVAQSDEERVPDSVIISVFDEEVKNMEA
jgi:hypothetical protein